MPSSASPASFLPERRFGLQAMLSHTVRAIQGVRSAEEVFVATNYEPAMRAAQENGWQILREQQQTSESDSVDAASRICERQGVTALLRLPLDLPLLQPQDIDELLNLSCAAPGMVIVPSRDGTGTNALLRTPPTLFPSHFGTGSFAKHTAEGQRAGAQVVVRRNPRLEMDVDDESDLRALLEHNLSGTETGRWLQKNKIDGIDEEFREPIEQAPRSTTIAESSTPVSIENRIAAAMT